MNRGSGRFNGARRYLIWAFCHASGELKLLNFDSPDRIDGQARSNCHARWWKGNSRRAVSPSLWVPSTGLGNRELWRPLRKGGKEESQ